MKDMRLKVVVLVAAGAASLVPLLAYSWAKAESSAETEQQIRRLEEERRQALLHNDAAAMDRLLGQEFVVTDVQGRVYDKANELQLYRSAARKTQSWEPSEVKVRVYDDMAVVTERAAIKDVLEGERRDIQIRLTHVWVKRDARWQVVARHATRIAEHMVAQQMTRITEAPSLPKANDRSSASAANTEQATGTRETSVEQEIRRLEDERAGAFERGDIELVKRMSSDDYIATSVTGQVKNKAQVLEEMTSGGRRLKFIHDDIRVRVYGNTAVITGRSTRKGRENNNEVDDQVRFTGVYAKQNGRWLKVAQQATRIGH